MVFYNKLYQNGIETAAYKPGYAQDIGSMNLTQIVNRPDYPLLTFNGYICEIIVYAATLSDFDRQRVENYLETKYGL